jgi:hypothetical protein
MIERHHQRPDDIIESGALDGRDHHGRRHARVELDVGHRGEFVLVDLNKRHIIGIVCKVWGRRVLTGAFIQFGTTI